ncbi:MAG: [FeFe] hydrogenase H-cluster radical SAM maturase HydE [Bacillota bacterium]
MARADQVRRKHLGNAVHFRGLVEISNHCRCNCLYCGLRRDNEKVRRYRMKPEEILSCARLAKKLGYGTVVLQSGEDPGCSAEMLAPVIRGIKRMGLAVTLSLGEREAEEYKLWKDAGADRYLLRHETADPELYGYLRPGRRLADRLADLILLRQMGYQVGMGFMTGLPGAEDRGCRADLKLMREMRPDMVGIGPFIPHPDTPFGREQGGELSETLRMIARVRLMLPYAHMPSTTALATLHPQGRLLGLQYGADVVMPNLTPAEYREDYTIYPGKAKPYDPCNEYRSLVKLLDECGLVMGKGPGHSIFYERRRKK